MGAGQCEKGVRRYRITFLPQGKVVEVCTGHTGQSGEGLPGSILDIATACGIEIPSACGGYGACGTCHVIVREGLESCSAPSEAEQDVLDQVPGVTLQSRLACQCVPNGTCDIVVEIPRWNRNVADSGH